MPDDYHWTMPFRTGRLRAQDVGKRNILEPVRFSDLIVILRNVPPALVLVKERNVDERSAHGNLWAFLNKGRL